MNSDKTQFIWVGSWQQLANVTVTEILLDGYRITASHNITCLGVHIDAELTFATHMKRVTSHCFYQLCQLWSTWPALSADNARMLAYAFIASQMDYYNSILYM